MPTGGEWRTRANALTGLRAIAAPGIAVAILAGAASAAALLFALAVLTDLADGRVARRYAESSPLGGFLDHAADAAFVSLGLAALAAGGEVPRLLAPLVAVAFVQYAVDSHAGRGAPLRGSRVGRWNGIAYFALVALPIGRDALGLAGPSRTVVLALGWVLVATTLVSIGDRLRVSLRTARGWRDAGTADRSPR